MESSEFYTCSLCGKTLLERLVSGVWVFRFGDSLADEDQRLVEIQLMGLLRMRCTRRSCRKKFPDHWNQFNVFP